MPIPGFSKLSNHRHVASLDDEHRSSGLSLLTGHRDEHTNEPSTDYSQNGSSSSSSHATPRQSSPTSKRTEKKAEKKKKEIIRWKDLPHKPQLTILTLARLSEPLVQTSLQSYMFYQLKSFDTSLPDSAIARQAGLLAGSFTGAQFLTAMAWGKIADTGGRKVVLVVGLLGTLISCVGFGFSTSFAQAIFWRTVGGALNGNVGVMRTMISEIIREKKYQSRAFLLLPMCWNIGVIVGPIMGGVMADPVGNYPSIFGGIKWMERFPYALPNLFSAVILLVAVTLVFFGLEETLESLRHKDDLGIWLGKKLASCYRRLRGRGGDNHTYHQVGTDTHNSIELETSPANSSFDHPRKQHPSEAKGPRYTQTLPFRRIFTRNVVFTLIAHGLLACHLGTFNNIWFTFLSTPVYDEKNPPQPLPTSYRPHYPFIFTGGLGLQPATVGLAMAILGVLGIATQLLIYPTLATRLGTVKSWRIFLCFFPLAYTLAPYLSQIPSSSPPPSPKSGPLIWISLCLVLCVQVAGRTFALPATTILVNNCSPHPSVLGTVHGLGQSVSAGMRTMGPILGGWMLGKGLGWGVVGLVWWGLGGVACAAVVASWWVREGTGWEVRLEGDEPDFELEAESKDDLEGGSGSGSRGSEDGDVEAGERNSRSLSEEQRR